MSVECRCTPDDPKVLNPIYVNSAPSRNGGESAGGGRCSHSQSHVAEAAVVGATQTAEIEESYLKILIENHTFLILFNIQILLCPDGYFFYFYEA